MSLYLCEGAGPRVFLYGTGITQVGDDYEATVETWDLTPTGEVGDCAFRTINVALLASNGYHIGVTPVVDGVELSEQTFNASGTGPFEVQAFIANRGTRIAANIRTISRSGEVEIRNVTLAFFPLRLVP